MFQFDIADLFPGFLLNDKNGHAMAKAIEAGLKYFLEKCQDGLDCVQNVEKMPEWRLDEMAWELNCLYDYTADVAAKRRWIRDAVPLFASYGTPSSIYNFLTGYFDDIELEENWQYSGDSFHFRVTLSGEWTDDREAWARKAIAAAKNVRSVMDTLAAGASAIIHFDGVADAVVRFPYPMTGDGTLAGTWPQTNIIGIIADDTVEMDAEAERFPFPYTQAGTVPDTATIGASGDAPIQIDGGAEGFVFPYNMPSDSAMTGTMPDTAVIGVVNDATIRADTEDGDAAFTIHYKLCGQDEI